MRFLSFAFASLSKRGNLGRPSARFNCSSAYGSASGSFPRDLLRKLGREKSFKSIRGEPQRSLTGCALLLLPLP